MKPSSLSQLDPDFGQIVLQCILWNFAFLSLALHLGLVWLTLPLIWRRQRGRWRRLFWTLGIVLVPYIGALLARRSSFLAEDRSRQANSRSGWRA